MKCNICGETVMRDYCLQGHPRQKQSRQLAQELNHLRGAKVEPGPDYAKFGEACARILREYAAKSYHTSKMRAFKAAATTYGIPLEEEK